MVWRPLVEKSVMTNDAVVHGLHSFGEGRTLGGAQGGVRRSMYPFVLRLKHSR